MIIVISNVSITIIILKTIVRVMLNLQQYLKENDTVEIPDVKHCLSSSSNVLPRLDCRTYKPTFFGQPKTDFHCEAIYKQIVIISGDL